MAFPASCALHAKRVSPSAVTTGGEQTKLVWDLMRAWQIGRLGGNTRAEPVLHDPLAVAVAFDPSLILQLEPMRVTVSHENNDPPSTIAVPGLPNAEVVRDVDRTRFEELFAKRILSRYP